MGKAVFKAFIAGGIVGMLSQGFLTIYAMFMEDFGMAVNLAIFTLAVGAGLLTAIGKFGKIDEFGGMGIGIPTCGLGSAITATILKARSEGKSAGKAVSEGLVLPFKILGTAAVIGLVGAILMTFVA